MQKAAFRCHAGGNVLIKEHGSAAPAPGAFQTKARGAAHRSRHGLAVTDQTTGARAVAEATPGRGDEA